MQMRQGAYSYKYSVYEVVCEDEHGYLLFGSVHPLKTYAPSLTLNVECATKNLEGRYDIALHPKLLSVSKKHRRLCRMAGPIN